MTTETKQMSDFKAKVIGYSVAYFFFAFMCVVTLGPIYIFVNRKALDRQGWIPHHERVNVYIGGNWFAGENRVCSGMQTLGGKNEKEIIRELHCPPDQSQYRGNVSERNLSVLFWGRLSRPGVLSADEEAGAHFSWNCLRRSDWPFSDQFTCYAIN